MTELNLNECRGLLDKTTQLLACKQRHAKYWAPDFNLINTLRSDEVTLSGYLKMLLDPNERHAQGALFLSNFVAMLSGDNSWIDVAKFQEAYVEKPTNENRRIDIYLEFENGVIAIENKPWAPDQEKQLEDYAVYAEREANKEGRGGNWLLIYLCDDEPSEFSISKEKLEEISNSGHYQRLNFDQIAIWLDESSRHVEAHKVRFFTEELALFFRKNFGGEMDMTEVTELSKMMAGESSMISSAFHVSAALAGMKTALLERLKKNLDEKAGAKGMKLFWQVKDKKIEEGFGFQLKEGDDYRLFYFFGNQNLNNFGWAIVASNPPRDVGSEQEKRAADIHDRMVAEGKKGENAYRESGSGWLWFSANDDGFVKDSERNWEMSEEPWLSMIDDSDKGLAHRLIEHASKVKGILKDVGKSLAAADLAG